MKLACGLSNDLRRLPDIEVPMLNGLSSRLTSETLGNLEQYHLLIEVPAAWLKAYCFPSLVVNTSSIRPSIECSSSYQTKEDEGVGKRMETGRNSPAILKPPRHQQQSCLRNVDRCWWSMVVIILMMMIISTRCARVSGEMRLNVPFGRFVVTEEESVNRRD